MESGRAIGFAPFTDTRTRVLVLGSLPGVASLNAGQYYAHPRNAFWPVMGALTGLALERMAYADRLAALRACGVGLWDVLASAQRAGSLDAAIRSPEAADLVSLCHTLPALQAIAFNGAKAASVGRRILTDIRDVALFDLPSTSPAHARPLVMKVQAWSVLMPYIVTRGDEEKQGSHASF